MEDRQRKYKCFYEDCSAKYRKKTLLEIHLRKHKGERPFACDYENCTKTYTNISHLKRHKCISHEKREELICKDCNLVLNNKYALKKHQNRVHSSREYPFNCNECSQGFSRKRQLQTHKFLHTGEPLFKCEPCNIKFVHEYEFNKHKFHHKIYTCECGEEFHRWSLILKHKKETCVQKRQFQCDVCHKMYSTAFNLKEHKKIHGDDKEKAVFHCPVENCTRSYFQKRNLNAHIQSFHEKSKDTGIRFPCTFNGCTKTLKTKRYLKLHLNKVHLSQPKPPTVRKPRKDKGIPKKCMASILSGVEIPSEEHKKIATNKPINKSKIIEQCPKDSDKTFDDKVQNVELSAKVITPSLNQIKTNKINNLLDNNLGNNITSIDNESKILYLEENAVLNLNIVEDIEIEVLDIEKQQSTDDCISEMAIEDIPIVFDSKDSSDSSKELILNSNKSDNVLKSKENGTELVCAISIL